MNLIITVTAALLALFFSFGSSSASSSPCINILHDEMNVDDVGRGPINAIFLANLLGHWPQYTLNIYPVRDYKSGQTESCKATLYVGTSSESAVPSAFLTDFFKTERSIAWIGFGIEKLNQKSFAEAFLHRGEGIVRLEDNQDSEGQNFFQHVIYKGQVFSKDSYTLGKELHGAFNAVRFVPVGDTANEKVRAYLVNNRTFKRNPYFLRSQNRFVVGDIPFSYMHEGGRYFAFADLLFDILDEKPSRTTPVAFTRIEDIHGFYELDMLKAALETLREADVPISIAHIPYLVDPKNVLRTGVKKKPVPATNVPNFVSVVKSVMQDKRNAIIWHGTTHQFGTNKNPYSGTSGDDYEFWDAVHDRPLRDDSFDFTVKRLLKGLTVFEAYGIEPRYWVTPHYKGSAVSNNVFGRVFPWVVGRVSYYPTSVGPKFTLAAVDRRAAFEKPSVDRKLLDDLEKQQITVKDRRSSDGEGQLFPYEIYRDIYGQRIIPETLGYISAEKTEQTPFVRNVKKILGDARRNSVVRDYWASVFFHPYIFSTPEAGGSGRFRGDTTQLQVLLNGLKKLGYRFIGLPEFEKSMSARGQLNQSFQTHGSTPRQTAAKKRNDGEAWNR